MVNTGGSSACGGDGASFSGPLDMTEQFFTSATFLFFLNLRRTFDVKRVEVNNIVSSLSCIPCVMLAPEVASSETEPVRGEPHALPHWWEGQTRLVLADGQLGQQQPGWRPRLRPRPQHGAAQPHVLHVYCLLTGVPGHRLGLVQQLCDVPIQCTRTALSFLPPPASPVGQLQHLVDNSRVKVLHAGRFDD